MRVLLTLALVAIVNAEGEPKLWPSERFEHVVAYCYDHTQDKRGTSITFPDGSLHTGVIRATTLRLNPNQVLKLRTLLSTDTGEEEAEVDCYDPHHAFVFYDAKWKVVSSIDICFLCENYVARPDGVAEVIDLVGLEAFCSAIGLPVLKSSADYSLLYTQEWPTIDSSKKSEPKEDSTRGDPFPGEVDPFAPAR